MLGSWAELPYCSGLAGRGKRPSGLRVQSGLSRRGSRGSGCFGGRLFGSLFRSGLLRSRLFRSRLFRYFLGSGLFRCRLSSSLFRSRLSSNSFLGRSFFRYCFFDCGFLSRSLFGRGLLHSSFFGRSLLGCGLLSGRLLSSDLLRCSSFFSCGFFCSCHSFLLDHIAKSTSRKETVKRSTGLGCRSWPSAANTVRPSCTSWARSGGLGVSVGCIVLDGWWGSRQPVNPRTARHPTGIQSHGSQRSCVPS